MTDDTEPRERKITVTSDRDPTDRSILDPTLESSAPSEEEAWPDPTPEMLADPLFDAIWQRIKTWDINVPSAYGGYCGATGNHVRAIFDVVMSERQRARDQALEEAAGLCEGGYTTGSTSSTLKAIAAAIRALKEQ